MKILSWLNKKPKTQYEASVEQIPESGNKEEAAKAYNQAVSVFDKGVKHRILHKNNAARKKARLAKKITQLG